MSKLFRLCSRKCILRKFHTSAKRSIYVSTTSSTCHQRTFTFTSDTQALA